VVTPVVMAFAQFRDHDRGESGHNAEVSLIAFLPLIYVTLAAGLALTKHRYVTLTTARIRHASHLRSPFEPDRLAGTLDLVIWSVPMSAETKAWIPSRSLSSDSSRAP
jgi:hypothetical protein